MSAIELRDVHKLWGPTKALDGITLAIAPASFCVLLGPSGCGKSTTLRIIAGLEAATSGSVFIGGRDVTQAAPAERGISMVFQNYALFPHLSVGENIGFGLSVRKVEKAEAARRIEQAAELLGLSALLARRPSQLSGGQQQRVALGRALVAQTKVCLMDEPLSNLDAQLRQEMRHELRELQQRLQLTVVYVTHDQAEAMSMADQVVLLNHGRIEQNAAPRELYARPASTFSARFIGTPAMNLLKLAQGRIAGSDVAPFSLAGRAGRAGGAAQLGIRPETVHLGGPVAATVASVEYLGADLVLRCAVGTETLTVRAEGQVNLAPGAAVQLGWTAEGEHFFDAGGRRTA
ncbi:MAG: ABC transporter ATP-binding protein [Rubrivivax sp.]|nr:ABC transporter ATP-binding protein [Rubrivivax sp.]